MYRIIFVFIAALGLASCSNTEKKINAQESYDVYISTIENRNPQTNEIAFAGPSINTMDQNNTFERYSLRTDQAQGGVKTYELLALLTYYSNWRYYDSATLENTPTTTFKVISREAGTCQEQGCVFKELMSIKLTDDFLHQHIDHGFQISISSKTGVKSDLFVPAQYIKGFLKAVDSKK